MPNLPILLHEFRKGINAPTLQNYKETLKTGLELLQSSSYDLPVLQYIFNNHIDFNDLCAKVESYLTTNVKFEYYRYTKYDAQFVENFDLDLSKHDIRSLLILIRCNYIANGAISKPVSDLIDTYEYIDRVKHKTSLETLKIELKDFNQKYLEKRYKDKECIKKPYELIKMIKANLYLLSYNHELSTQSQKNGRIYNAFTSLNRVYRNNELAFQLGEFDIKSANPQIIDKIFSFNNWRNVYNKLMQAYDINRSEAKIKYNATLNNYYLSHSQAKEVYLKAGYSDLEADKVARFTAQSNKGYVFKVMAKYENEIINEFVNLNFKKQNFIRLHDAVYYEPEFVNIDLKPTNTEFSHSITAKENLSLNLVMNTYKTVLSTPDTNDFIIKQYFDKSKTKLQYKGDNFSFYDANFLQLNARFNLCKPIIEDNEYRTPSDLEFISRIKKLYLILYYLNDDTSHFKTCIEHISKQEGISFNKNYIYQLAKEWQTNINDALQYVKSRNWTYNGSSVSTKKFNEFYHKERSEYINKIQRKELKKDLQTLLVSIQKNNTIHYIDKADYYNAKRYQVGDIINKVYDLIGIKKKDTIQRFNRVVHILDKVYMNNNIGCQKTVPPIREVSKNLNIHRTLAKKIVDFKANKLDIIDNIRNAISNIEDLTNIDALFDTPVINIDANKTELRERQPDEVFTRKPDEVLEAVLLRTYKDVTHEDALVKDIDYYTNYIVNRSFASHILKNGVYNTNDWDKEKPIIKGKAVNYWNKNHIDTLADYKAVNFG